MRRVRLGGVAAALMVGLGVAVATTRGADKEGSAPAAKGLLSDLFKDKSRPQGKQGQGIIEESPQAAPLPSLESASADQHRHQNAWIRRAEVCGRLRMIADQTGNETLWNLANDLEERATAIYRQQTSGLSFSAPVAPVAAVRANPSADRRAAASARPGQLPNGRGPDRTKAPAVKAPLPLSGSIDQREQAILNGSSMGGN